MGEIQVHGPWITGGYLHEGATHEKFTADGWLRTGDIASCDEQGSIRITDRTKDLIKSGGEWISSVTLENLIMGHPAVAEAAVIAMPHPKWDERPLAIVVLKPGQSLGADELLAFMQPHVASWWLPDEVILADEIPRTSTGKFNKLALRERYAAGKTP
jgi:fatty-acyl-CoA synthase